MPTRSRPGVTLVELLLFIAITAMVLWVSIPLMVTTGTSQVKQEALSTVERTGSQILQTIGQTVRSAERLYDLPPGQSGHVLALKMRDDYADPTIIGLTGSSLLYYQGTIKRPLTPPEIRVDDFIVRNTSGGGSRTGVYLRFTLRYTLPLLQSGSFIRTYDTSYTLFPDDVLTQSTCSCAAPHCLTQNTYQWNTCDVNAPTSCVTSTEKLTCTP